MSRSSAKIADAAATTMKRAPARRCRMARAAGADRAGEAHAASAAPDHARRRSVSGRTNAGANSPATRAVAQHDEPVADARTVRRDPRRTAAGPRRRRRAPRGARAQRLGAARVEPAGRIERDDELRVVRELARQHDALLIAAGKPAALTSSGVGGRREARGALVHVRGEPRPIDARGPCDSAGRRRGRDSRARSRAGMSASAAGSSGMLATPLSRICAADQPVASSPHKVFDAAARADEAEHEVGEFALAVAGDAGDAEDFAAAQPAARDRARRRRRRPAAVCDALERQHRFAAGFSAARPQARGRAATRRTSGRASSASACLAGGRRADDRGPAASRRRGRRRQRPRAACG